MFRNRFLPAILITLTWALSSTAHAQLLGSEAKDTETEQPTPRPAMSDVDPALLIKYQALKDRRAALDARRDALLDRDPPATAEELQAIERVEAELLEEQKIADERQDRADMISGVLAQMKELGFVGAAAPLERLQFGPEIVFLTQASKAHIKPDETSRSLITFNQDDRVLKVAELDGIDWVMVWIKTTRRLAFMPSGAVEALE